MSGRALTTNGQTLETHDGENNKESSIQGMDVSEESMTNIEKMIRKLLYEKKEDFKQMMQEQTKDTKRDRPIRSIFKCCNCSRKDKSNVNDYRNTK